MRQIPSSRNQLAPLAAIFACLLCAPLCLRLTSCISVSKTSSAIDCNRKQRWHKKTCSGPQWDKNGHTYLMDCDFRGVRAIVRRRGRVYFPPRSRKNVPVLFCPILVHPVYLIARNKCIPSNTGQHRCVSRPLLKRRFSQLTPRNVSPSPLIGAGKRVVVYAADRSAAPRLNEMFSKFSRPG